MLPKPDIRLTAALARERSLDGKRSGRRANSGVRHTAMATSIRLAEAIVSANCQPRALICPFSAGGMNSGPIGIRAKASAATGAKISMNGMRRPMRVLVLSLTGPISGWMKNAARLSSVMMKPVAVAVRPNPSAPALPEKARLPDCRKIGM